MHLYVPTFKHKRNYKEITTQWAILSIVITLKFKGYL